MRILHISDFHYKPSKKFDQQKLVDQLINKSKAVDPIDFIFFTGDLVNSGTVEAHFWEAGSLLLDGLSTALNVKKNNIFICGGNHDVDRSAISESIKSHFELKIKDNNDLNAFANKPSPDYNLSKGPISNYIKYASSIYSGAGNQINDLYSSHIRIIEDESVGIISINSAWCCTGDDFGKLYFPVDKLKEALLEIQNQAQFKILLLHHPLSWFKDFNSFELEELIHKEFNMVFSGHVHSNQISTHYVSNKGIFSHVAPAALSFEKDAILGYSILECPTSNPTMVEVSRYTFNKKSSLFNAEEKIDYPIPYGDAKFKEIKFKLVIADRWRKELEKANELLLSYAAESDNNFLDLYNNPNLSTKSDADISGSDSILRFDHMKFVNDEEDSKDNFFIFGKDKFGKTSFLKWLLLNYLKSYNYLSIIPYYIDCREIEGKGKPINFLKSFSSYYELNKKDTEAKIRSNNIKLLIDNFQSSPIIMDAMKEFMAQFPTVSYVISSDQTLLNTIEQIDINNTTYTKLYLNDLSRKEIRSYTTKSINLPAETREVIMERIIKMCKEIQLPANYWTVSLMLYIYSESRDNYRKNIFDILDLVIDKILNKEYLVLSNSKYSFEQYKLLCAEIAYFLLTDTNCKENIHSSSYDELVRFVANFNATNPRIVADNRQVIEYLIKCGMLTTNINDRYTFRLNGFFEYFLAYYMIEHPEFKDEIISSDEIYLSFKNEFEIYSSLVRNDDKLVKAIFDKTRIALEEMVSPYNGYSIDNLLTEKVTHVQNITDKIKELNVTKPMAREAIDEMLDASEPISVNSAVKNKQLFDIALKNPEIFERYLSILARIYKNSDRLKSNELVLSIFDFLLESYCLFSSFLIDSVESSRDTNTIVTEEEKETEVAIFKMLSSFVPTMVQMLFSESVGHFSLEKIIRDKINDLKKDSINNQYKLFILYFLLVDQNLTKSKALVEEVIELTSIGILKYSVLLKLQYYLAFKAYDNPGLEQDLRNAIQKSQIHLDSKVKKNLGEVHKGLDDQHKYNIIKKEHEK